MIEIGDKGRPSVLLVDDEPAILESLAELLRKEFHVLGTTDVDESVEILRANPIAILISDQRMPRITGVELLTRSVHISPDTVRVLLTAYMDVEAVIQAINDGRAYYYLVKPWDGDHLLKLVRSAARHYQLVSANRQLVQKLAELGERVVLPPEQRPANSGCDGDDPEEVEHRVLNTSLNLLSITLSHLERIGAAIPLCLSCGKLKALGENWIDLLELLKQNYALFSHGYCPECAARTRSEWERESGPAVSSH